MIWCSVLLCLKPSKSLQSELESAAATGLTTTPIVSIDCTLDSIRDKRLCERYDINAYPTIRLFRKGHSNQSHPTVGTRYRGARTASTINSYLLKQHLPPVTILTSKEALDNFKAIDDHVFIVYLDDSSSSPPSSSGKKDGDDAENLLQEIFTSVARDNHHHFVFGMVLDRELAEADKLPVPPPCIVSYKVAEDDNEALQLSNLPTFTRETLEDFVSTTAHSAIGEITRRNTDGYFASPRPILAYIFYDNPTDRTNLRRELIPVAKRYRGYVQFVTIDGEEYGHMASSLELKSKPGRERLFPAFVVHAMFNDQVFVYDQDAPITRERVDRFVLDILQGKMSPTSGHGETETEKQDEKNDHDEL
ncbi:hypothetical protein VTN77DRAFT_5366 [Rasamsonia byssochlamydoides]|uniref:uncharacterized protein n=1 Tax=Rasamsonia byssochlamydoides TaxID=89139 RepID=UPI0037446E9C